MPQFLAYIVGVCIITIFAALIVYIIQNRPKLDTIMFIDDTEMYIPKLIPRVNKGAVLLNSGLRCPGCGFVHNHVPSYDVNMQYLCLKCFHLIMITEHDIAHWSFKQELQHRYATRS